MSEKESLKSYCSRNGYTPEEAIESLKSERILLNSRGFELEPYYRKENLLNCNLIL